MDAPFSSWEPSGRAVWYSFGTLLINAASITLQIDPGELHVGVRPVSRSPDRIHGEVFLYDDVPSGAGYARAIRNNLEEIMHKALDIGEYCPNPDCKGACYYCMFDYRNQYFHPILDRNLGASLLRFLLKNELPTVRDDFAQKCTESFVEYARNSWEILPSQKIGSVNLSTILRDSTNQMFGIWIIHPLEARPSEDQKAYVLNQSGIRCAVHSTFDLQRRPFWVLNNLLNN